jgi:hypothetical protein
MFSLEFENDPKLFKQRARVFIPRPLHLYEDYNTPLVGWEAV